MQKLMIVDGHLLLFQMFYGMPNKIKNSNGENIEAVIGFIGALLKAANTIDPDYIYVVFDGEINLKRQELNRDYKNNRIDYSAVGKEENPFSQLDFIKASLKEMNVEYSEMTDCEADDFIAGLCNKYSKDYAIVIMSQDKDFFQIINENVKVYSYRGKSSKLWGVNEVFTTYNVHPSQWIIYKALTGDSSDNIKGVRGVGPKTAIKIINKNKNLDEILLRFSQPEREQIKNNIKLIDLSTNKCSLITIDNCLCNTKSNVTMNVLKNAGVL